MSFLSANVARFGLMASDLEGLVALQGVWVARFAEAGAVATRTAPVVRARLEARWGYERALRAFAMEHLARSGRVGDGDRVSLGLRVRGVGGVRAGAPVSVPWVRVLLPEQRRLVMEFKDEGEGRRGKPRGVWGVELRYGLLGVRPSGVEGWGRSCVATRGPFVLDFDEGERGGRVFFCLRWLNARGVGGPWGELLSAIVP